MSAALASPIARPSVGRTFIIAISVLGLVAFAQLGAVGWVFVNSFQTLTERAKVGPGRKAVADNEKNGGNLAATETTDTLEAKDPFVDGESPNATSASADPIPPPPKPVPVSPSKLNPPTAPPENRFQELLQQGKQLRDRGDTGAALTRLREAQAIDPTNPEAIAEIAVTYERMSLMDKAGEQWRRIYEMGDAAGAFYYAADARLKMSQAQALAAVNIARSSDGEVCGYINDGLRRVARDSRPHCTRILPSALAWRDVARYTVKVEEDSKAAAWTFVGMILAFKVVTSIIIFVMAPSAHAAVFLFAMQWYWLLLPLPMLVVPFLFWFRLRRVRKKRRQLILSEWAVDAEADWNPTSVRGTM